MEKRSPVSALMLLSAVSALMLCHGCASKGEQACELRFDGQSWNQDAIPKGFAAAGIQAKPVSAGKDGGRFDGGGVSASYALQPDGKVLVTLQADGPDSAKILPALSNGIGMAMVPKDKLRKHPPR